MLRPEKLSDLAGGGQRGSSPGWCTSPREPACVSLPTAEVRGCVLWLEIDHGGAFTPRKSASSTNQCSVPPALPSVLASLASTGGSSGKEPACRCRRPKRCRFDPWVGTIHWRRAWQPTPVFLPGRSQAQRSLVGYSPLGHRELVTTEATQHAHIRYKTVWLIQPSFLSLQVSTLTHRENVKSPCASYEVITAHGGREGSLPSLLWNSLRTVRRHSLRSWMLPCCRGVQALLTQV